MRKPLVALFIALTVATVAGCSSGKGSEPTTPSGTPVLEVPSAAGTGTGSAPTGSIVDDSGTSADTAATQSPATAGPETSVPATSGPDAIELPPLSGLPVRTLPLPPGATATRDTTQAEDSSTQSYTVTLAGSTGADLATWYRTALTDAGFAVGDAAADGGFDWQGSGVTGTGAVSGDGFVLTVGPTG